MDRIETLLRVLVSVLLYEECSLLWRLVRGFLLAYEDICFPHVFPVGGLNSS